MRDPWLDLYITDILCNHGAFVFNNLLLVNEFTTR